jgi:RHS repeat-associated protein
MTKVTKFVWDPVFDCVQSELDETNAVTATYTNEPQPYGGVLSQHRNGVTSTLHADALGSTRAVTDSSENVTDTYTYDAWGNKISSTGGTELPFKWVGRSGYYSDQSSGLVYVRARTYQPIVARWGSADPIGIYGGLNFFLYLGQSPLLGIDPSGLIRAVKRIAPFPVTCNGEYWWKFSRGNDDSFASPPWDGNFQSAIICLELDIDSDCRLPGGLSEPDLPERYHHLCCLGKLEYRFRYRAVQTGFVYDDLPPNVSNGTAWAFHHDTFTAQPSSSLDGCTPSGMRLRLLQRNLPPSGSSKVPWGQGSSLSAAFNCDVSCRFRHQEYAINIHRDADAGLIFPGSLLQSISFGGSREKCWHRRPDVFASVQHYPNSPDHRAVDMVRLIEVSPSVGFVGPLQEPHEPQPVWPQS